MSGIASASVGGQILELLSSDDTLDIRAVAQGRFDFKAGVGIHGTLQSIYAAGLAHNPDADNLFIMPSGNMRFPGPVDWGTRWGAATTWWQDRTKVSLIAPPAAVFFSNVANNSGVGGSGDGDFELFELNDPAWGGSFGVLNATWPIESVLYSADQVQTSLHQSTRFGRRSYNSFGQSPMTVPDVGLPVGHALVHELTLYNSVHDTVSLVDRVTGFGSHELSLINVQGGAPAQWVTHWDNQAAAPAAGDGPAWWVDIDGRFDHFSMGAGVNPYQTTALVTDPWGVRLWGRDGAGTPHNMLDVTPTLGLLNGGQLATFDSTPAATVVYATDVDITAVATHQLHPTRAGHTFVPTRLPVTVISLTGPAVGAAAGSVGTNAPTYTNAIAALAGSITAAYLNAGSGSTFYAAPNATLIGSTIPMFVNITAAPAGVTAGILRFSLEGYWTPTVF